MSNQTVEQTARKIFRLSVRANERVMGDKMRHGFSYLSHRHNQRNRALCLDIARWHLAEMAKARKPLVP
jgi:hypothetical protein